MQTIKILLLILLASAAGIFTACKKKDSDTGAKSSRYRLIRQTNGAFIVLYTYDPENRLRSTVSNQGDSMVCQYDESGRQVKTLSFTKTTVTISDYVYNPDGSIKQVLVNYNNNQKLSRFDFRSEMKQGKMLFFQGDYYERIDGVYKLLGQTVRMYNAADLPVKITIMEYKDGAVYRTTRTEMGYDGKGNPVDGKTYFKEGNANEYLKYRMADMTYNDKTGTAIVLPNTYNPEAIIAGADYRTPNFCTYLKINYYLPDGTLENESILVYNGTFNEVGYPIQSSYENNTALYEYEKY